MKRILSCLAALLLLCCLGVPALALDETQSQGTVTISAEVPAAHTVTIQADGGRVVADNAVCGASVQIERQKAQTWWIIPDQGKELERLYYGGEDVTAQVKAGVFTAPALVGDLTLEAVFKDAPPAESEKGCDISGTVTDEDGKPLPGVTVEIGGQTDTTDEDGNFTVEDVPPGTWPVVVTDKDDEVIGLGEITIGTPDGGDFTVTEDEYGNPVIQPGGDTDTIDLTLQIGSDGGVRISDVKDATKQPSKPGGKPAQTGDSGIVLYALLAAAGAGWLILTLARGMKRTKG